MKIKNFQKKLSSEKLVNFSELIGYLIADGCIVANRNKSIYSIRLENTDKSMHKRFQIVFNEIFGVKPKTYGDTRTQISSKDAAQFLLEILNTVRTKRCSEYPSCPLLSNKEANRPCVNCEQLVFDETKYPTITIPEFIKNNERCSVAFLKAMVSCDGGVTLQVREQNNKFKFSKGVILSSKNPQIRNFALELLEKLEIKTNFDKHHTIKISRYKDIKKFYTEIGFVGKCKVSRTNSRWYGLEKNNLLKLLFFINSKPYGFWINNFSSKNEIIDYLLLPQRNLEKSVKAKAGLIGF